MTSHIIGLVLAGGKSSRMKTDKSLLLWQGSPFYQIVANKLTPLVSQVYISCRPDQRGQYPDYPVITDKFADIGPLSGIISTIEQFPDMSILMVSCDMPEIPEALLKTMIHHNNDTANGVFIKDAQGNIEPMVSILNTSSHSYFLNSLHSGEYSITKIIKNLPAPVFIETNDPLHNINSPENLEELINRNFRSE
ncbi:MAG: molybdenum cofactor guanylyltransferase [Saprospiraceae bacterium]|nr:molybdenum cofactor guanylyltransferase [Saprospiraceae bacterium]